ncbi:MAG: sulfurtransferase complex subunit TusB [Candidatus Bathyarchaeota archaeon]
MSKLIVMNTHNPETLEKALKTENEIILMQDAVLFTNNGVEANNKLHDHKIYALVSDVEKRGLKNRVLQGIELIDVDAMVDLLFSGKTVINL